ncbi:hypothetical protein NG795_20050 [Laspinema sp. D3]|nr:hypothetical protein [Laspinema sp. D2c]
MLSCHGICHDTYPSGIKHLFGEIRIHVCSNDFSRCYRVMADAMTLTLLGLSTCLGTGAIASFE